MVDGRVSLFLALVTILTASNYVRGHLTKDYTIQLLWNGQGLNQSDWVHFSIGESENKDGVEINIDAPFYDDPAPPNAQPGEAFFGLWNYEVVECFFLSQNPTGKFGEPDYLELEFGPHGQHLGLLLHGVRQDIAHSFPMQYEAEISPDRKSWKGKAVVPKHYFPPNVNRFNAYAINKPEEPRAYKSLYPSSGAQPDFHALQYFLPYDGRFIDGLYSEFWSNALTSDDE